MATHAFKLILLDLLQQAQRGENAFWQALDPAERAASGTPELWAAKDHVAHMTFWRQRLVQKLTAILQQQELPPDAQSYEQLNPIIFEEQCARPWSDTHAESEQVYAELLKLTGQLSEEDLTASGRFTWINEGEPLYIAFMGNCYEHAQEHLAQYCLDRHDLPQATQVRETWVERIVQSDAPGDLKGTVLYNLACFYALHEQLEKASRLLQESLTLAPRLKEWSLSDPDLVALRSR